MILYIWVKAMYKRLDTKKIKVGNIYIGGQNKVIIQSMTNTKTKDIDKTVEQILSLEKVGCEIIRVAVLDEEDAKAIKYIKERISIPLVADIHFDYRLALICIENGIDKIRINPGNIGKKENIIKVVTACKEKNIPIRIGVNGGSLEKDLLEKYGHNSPIAIVESCKRQVKILEDLGFYDIVISLKSSSVISTIEAYKLASQEFPYPLHLGVTEAGALLTSSIRSSAGLGVLLYEGIGDTIRISISDEPIKEIRVCKELLKNFNLYKNFPTLISCPTCGRLQYNAMPIYQEMEEFLSTINKDITVAIMGCVVNGPTEAKNADIGIAGGINEALLFKKGKIIRKIKEEDIISVLKEEIINF